MTPPDFLFLTTPNPLHADCPQRDRAQVGVGTLLVFLGLVLAAAIAGSVLISTGDSLAQQGGETAEDSTGQVSTDLLPVMSTARLDDEPSGVRNLTTTIQLAPGSGQVDLRDATISISTSDGEFTRSNGTSHQGVEILKNPVLSNTEDVTKIKSRIRFQFDDGSNGIETDNGVLEPGTEVLIRITTMSGARVDISITVDRPLDPQYTGGERIRIK
jgi:archaellin